MHLLYSLGIYFYYLAALLASPFHLKAKKWIRSQSSLMLNIKELTKKLNEDRPRIWIHCASLGEFEQSRSVIEMIKQQQPETYIILTFFSPSGYAIRKDYPYADIVSYLPLDTKHNARKFLSIIQPDRIIFIKYEFWYHFLSEAKKRKIPAYLLSAKFRKDQIFFRSYGSWYFRLLSFFDHLFVQDEVSARLLQSKKHKLSFSVNGDTRFDRVASIAEESGEIDFIKKFCKNTFTLIAGSTWAKDEDILTEYINRAETNMQFIIAPHEITNEKVNLLSGKIKKRVITYTDRSSAKGDEQVLILDTIGILSSCYKYGTIAYIGGGFGQGIHNILEAATFGLPVIFGPNHYKFKEATDLKEKGGAFAITDQSSFNKTINQFIHTPEKIDVAGRNAKDYVMKNTGATYRFYHHIFPSTQL